MSSLLHKAVKCAATPLRRLLEFCEEVERIKCATVVQALAEELPLRAHIGANLGLFALLIAYPLQIVVDYKFLPKQLRPRPIPHLS